MIGAFIMSIPTEKKQDSLDNCYREVTWSDKYVRVCSADI